MKTEQPTVAELNEAQAAWMAVRADAPSRAETERAIKLMARVPKCYVATTDRKYGRVMAGGPLTAWPLPMAQAIEIARKHGGRVDVAWDGEAGQWYATGEV